MVEGQSRLIGNNLGTISRRRGIYGRARFLSDVVQQESLKICAPRNIDTTAPFQSPIPVIFTGEVVMKVEKARGPKLKGMCRPIRDKPLLRRHLRIDIGRINCRAQDIVRGSTADFDLWEVDEATELDADRVVRFELGKPSRQPVRHHGIDVFDLEQERIIPSRWAFEDGDVLPGPVIDARRINPIAQRDRLGPLAQTVVHDRRFRGVGKIAVLHDRPLPGPRRGIERIVKALWIS